MKKYIYIKSIAWLLCWSLFLAGCKKMGEGYISDYMYYLPQMLEAPQGRVVSSNPLALDGGTGPMQVHLLDVRNKRTGAHAGELLEEYDALVFSGQVTAQDTTPELLLAKVTTGKLAPLTVNALGGRVTLTQTTLNVDTGLYTIDVQASNDRGTKTISEAIDLHIVMGSPYSIGGGPFASSSPVGLEDNFVNLPAPIITVAYDANADNKIRIRVVDDVGNAFNPSAGEIVLRGDRGHFGQLNPHYPEVRTNDAMEWGFVPIPNGFPILTGTNGTLCYYRIPGAYTTLGRNINFTFDALKVYADGEYTFTIRLPSVIRK